MIDEKFDGGAFGEMRNIKWHHEPKIHFVAPQAKKNFIR
jgi:hypothetical protein